MFEDALFISQVRHSSVLERWPALASFSIQIAIGIVIAVLPLLHPIKLALHQNTPPVLIAPMQKPPIPIQRVKVSSLPSSSATLPTTVQTATKASIFRNLLPYTDNSSLTLPSTSENMMEATTPIGSTFAETTSAPHVVVATAHTVGRVHVSSGVLSGMLVTPIHPTYPEIARIARVEGTVIVEAVITSTGTIDQMRIVSGPPMLRQAALNAIRTARYQPYRLNGSPIEVQTTISVNFHLGS